MLFMYSAVSSGPLLRNVHASSSDRTVTSQSMRVLNTLCFCCTFQSVDCPLFKFLKCDFGRWWQYVKVETVLICLFLELCFGELLLLVTEVCASLGVDSGVVVADHRCLCV